MPQNPKANFLLVLRIIQIFSLCLSLLSYPIISALAADSKTTKPAINKSSPIDAPNTSIKVIQAISISVEPKEWVIGCADINSTLNYQKPDINSNAKPENSSLNQINPEDLDIGCVYVYRTFTQNENSKITVTNNGIGKESFELKLIDPPGWASSIAPGQETYVLSGIFCGINDIPQKDSFNQDTGYEDIIFVISKIATSTIFGYSQATANGTKVPSGESRSLYLQFKSPTATNKTTEQIISVIVSCEPDY